MEEESNTSQEFVNDHNCSSFDRHPKRPKFCRICGIHLPTSSNLQMLRSQRYNHQKLYSTVGLSIVNNMVKKQTQNRYYNANPSHLQFR